MNPRRVPILRFLRDLALSLPVFYERRQHAIVSGDFVPVPGVGLRPNALQARGVGSVSLTSLTMRRHGVSTVRATATSQRASVSPADAAPRPRAAEVPGRRFSIIQ